MFQISLISLYIFADDTSLLRKTDTSNVSTLMKEFDKLYL